MGMLLFVIHTDKAIPLPPRISTDSNEGKNTNLQKTTRDLF